MDEDQEPPKIEAPEEDTISDRQKRLAENLLTQQMDEVFDTVDGMLAGDPGVRPLLLVSGPKGINKTYGVKGRMRLHSARIQHQWENTDEDQRPPHLTGLDANGRPLFIPPIFHFPTHTTIAGFDELLAAYPHRGQALLLDDPAMIHNQTIAKILMAWSSGTREWGRYTTRKEKKQSTQIAHSVMIILDNYNENEMLPGKRRRGEHFLADRGHITLTRQRSVLFEYVEISAFPDDADYNNGSKWWEYGIYKHLFAKPAGHPEVTNLDEAGLGFTGSDAEAVQAVTDVQKWFNEKCYRVKLISFRFLQDILRLRIQRPMLWRQRADAKLSRFDLPWEDE